MTESFLEENYFQGFIEKPSHDQLLLQSMFGGEIPSTADANLFIGYGALLDVIGKRLENKLLKEGWTTDRIQKARKSYQAILHDQYPDEKKISKKKRKKIRKDIGLLRLWHAQAPPGSMPEEQRFEILKHLTLSFNNPSSWKP